MSSTNNKKFGALLDVTSVADGRDPHVAKAISESLQIHVVIGTSSPGPSKENSEPPNNDTEASQQDIEFMEQELLYGIETNDNSDNNSDSNAITVCAGFIGEIEISKDFPPSELRQLKAAAVVQKTTNAPLIVAPGPHAIPVLDHIEACGATLPRVVLTHMDLYADNLPFLKQVLDRGVVLCFDRFSVSYACWDPDQQFPTIPQVVHCIQQLLQHNPNYIHQIVLSSGVFMKLQYRKYGGMGFGALPDHLLPRLGIPCDQIQTMIRDNPRRLLQWWKPPPPKEVPKEYIPCSVCKTMFEPILGEYYTKYTFTYCGTDCLRKHRQMKFKPLE